jgi:hypothetical protein
MMSRSEADLSGRLPSVGHVTGDTYVPPLGRPARGSDDRSQRCRHGKKSRTGRVEP